MPKELVYSVERPYSDVSSAQSVIGVHWGREGSYVQVSTSLFNDDGRSVDGEGTIHVAEGEEAKRREIWSQGFYVDLDRSAINRLIRNLRRARDQAFGRDE